MQWGETKDSFINIGRGYVRVSEIISITNNYFILNQLTGEHDPQPLPSGCLSVITIKAKDGVIFSTFDVDDLLDQICELQS